jgi:hypothetical protein
MRMPLLAMAMTAFLGFCSQASAQDRCPELARLRSDAAHAAEQMRGAPTSERCAEYTRFSVAWGAIANTPMTIVSYATFLLFR